MMEKLKLKIPRQVADDCLPMLMELRSTYKTDLKKYVHKTTYHLKR